MALARRVGNEIWKRHRIPVFFYEAAATRPERTNLENIRRGQFEGLREDIKRNHDRQPDVGEPKLHPTAGTTVVGARKFLVAYNVNLNTSDIGIANKIAKAIRFSSGGLRHVKSMGVALKARNLAQVSINLTDFEATPMHRVYEMVKREAERYGAIPVGSEIVGLVPEKSAGDGCGFLFAAGRFFAFAGFGKSAAGGARRRASGSPPSRRESSRCWQSHSWKLWPRPPQRPAAAVFRRLLAPLQERLDKWWRAYRGRKNRKQRSWCNFQTRSSRCAALRRT